MDGQLTLLPSTVSAILNLHYTTNPSRYPIQISVYISGARRSCGPVLGRLVLHSAYSPVESGRLTAGLRKSHAILVPQPPPTPLLPTFSSHSVHPPCHIKLVSGPNSLSGSITEAPMTDLTQKLPVEMLAEILGHASAPEILRSKQVKSLLLIYGCIN